MACVTILASEKQIDSLHSLRAQIQVSLGDLACWTLAPCCQATGKADASAIHGQGLIGSTQNQFSYHAKQLPCTDAMRCCNQAICSPWPVISFGHLTHIFTTTGCPTCSCYNVHTCSCCC